jgi:hypothetical protein
VARTPLWIYVDIERLAEAIDRERVLERPATRAAELGDAELGDAELSAVELSAVELFAVVRRSAGLHARISPLPPAAVARMTRSELRRILGPIVEVLDDDALRRHALRVLAGYAPN